MHQLDNSIKTVWGISIILKTFFYSIVVFFIDFLLIRNNLNYWFLPHGMLSLIIFIIGLILTFVIPLLNYKFWKFEVLDTEIYIERGILTRIKTTAPFSRIQHLDVQQTLIERFFHLGKLVLYTAGTRGADVVIPGLPIEYAEDLRDKLKDITAEDSI
jgi:membrane protein YdbS with pleckstrin-like domain